MNRILIFLLCCMVSWSAATVTVASSPGNLLGMLGTQRVAVSAEWDQDNRDLDDSKVTSNRYWLKGTYGLFDWLDVSGAGGFADFNVCTNQNARSFSFESHHLTFGFRGGLKMRPFHQAASNVSTFLTAQGSHLQAEEFRGPDTPNKLSWNEFQLAICLAKEYGFAFPYGGVLYSVVDGEMRWDGSNGADFRDPGALAFAGIDFSLPSHYVISFEVRGRLGGESDEVSFSVGLSQSSK